MPVQNVFQNALQPKSVQDFDNEAMQAQQSRMALQTNALALQDRQRAATDQVTLRNALMGLGANATDDQRIQALKATGLPTGFTQADALEKAGIERLKGTAAAAKDTAQGANYDQESKTKALELHKSMLTMVRSPQDMATWIDGMYANPATRDVAIQVGGTPEQAKQRIPTNPADFQDYLRMNAMGMDKYIQDQTAQRGQTLTATTSRSNNADNNARAAAEGAASRAVQMRGQNMTDARARESTVATMTKPFEVTGPDGTPMLVQQDKKGNITPVTGFGPKVGSAKPLNDSQAKALGFGTRMQEADKLLNSLEAKGVSTPSMPKMLVGDTPILGAMANMAASPNQQSVDQAQRDFVNAILRRESGAAISSSEFDNARRQYFSQTGDSKQVKDQKAANRKLAMEGVIAEVPVGQRGTIGPGAKTAAAPATAGGWSYVGPVK